MPGKGDVTDADDYRFYEERCPTARSRAVQLVIRLCAHGVEIVATIEMWAGVIEALRTLGVDNAEIQQAINGDVCDDKTPPANNDLNRQPSCNFWSQCV